MRSSAPRRLPPYRYRCTDKSWLTAKLAVTVVPRIERRLPAGLPANLVTLASSLCLGLMAVLLQGPAAGRPAAVLAGIALLAAYTLLDMVDGQHARRLGTSSPLGEYLDHALDILNAALVAAVVFWVKPGWSAAGLGLLLAAVNLAFVATLVEQKVCGEMRLGRIGPVEGLVLAAVYLASWLAPGAAAWWAQPALAGWSRWAVVMAAVAAGLVVAAGACVARMRRLPGALAAFAAGLAAPIAALFLGVSPAPVLLALALGAADFGSRVLARHLLAEPLPRPDWPAPAALAAAVVLATLGLAGVAGVLAWLAAVWLAARVAANFAGALRVYRQFWTWWHRPAAVGGANFGRVNH